MEKLFILNFKAKVLIFLALFVIFVKTSSSAYLESGTYSSHYPVSYSDDLGGTWKLTRKWKYYWVKDWEAKKVYLPTWKKVWTPVDIKEWIPVPNTPHK